MSQDDRHRGAYVDRRRVARDELHRKIAALNLRGLRDPEIARELGVNVNTVVVALDRPARELHIERRRA